MLYRSIDPQEEYDALQALLNQAAFYLTWTEDQVFNAIPDESGWSIGFQLYHVTLANASIPRLIERMKTGVLGEKGLERDAQRIKALMDGSFPSGLPAPDRVIPPDDVDMERLTRDFNRMRKATQRIEPLLHELDRIPVRFPSSVFRSVRCSGMGPIYAYPYPTSYANHRSDC